MTMLTPHFTLAELTNSQTAARKGINNVPAVGSLERANLQRLAETLEDVRIILKDRPILISSGYRGRAVNRAVGGSTNSAHMHGLAADFICPGFGTPLEICRALRPHMQALEIDQLIHEFDTWVHMGLRGRGGAPPRHMALTIDNRGTRTGFA